MAYILDIYAFIEKKITPQIQPDLVNTLAYAWKVISSVDLERNFTGMIDFPNIYLSVDAIFSRLCFLSGSPYRGLPLRPLN